MLPKTIDSNPATLKVVKKNRKRFLHANITSELSYCGVEVFSGPK